MTGGSTRAFIFATIRAALLSIGESAELCTVLETKSGFVDASDRDSAIASISAEGRYVVEIKEQKARLGNRRLVGQSGFVFE